METLVAKGEKVTLVCPFYCNRCKKTTVLDLARPVSELVPDEYRRKVLEMIREGKKVNWDPPDTPEGEAEVRQLEKETICSQCERGWLQFIWSF